MSDKKASKISTIKKYFGYRSGEGPGDFMKEIKALTTEDRLELAQGSAAALGLKQAEVDFPLA